MKRFIGTTILCLILVGCGFHLRGGRPIAPSLRVIYIETSNTYGYITLRLKEILGSMHINVVKTPEQSPIVLKLYDEAFSTSNLSDSASSSTKTYLLHYQISFALLTSDGADIYGPKTIQTSRSYIVNEDQVLSSTNETTLLQQTLQRDAMYQIVNQLGSPDAALAIEKIGGNHETTP